MERETYETEVLAMRTRGLSAIDLTIAAFMVLIAVSSMNFVA